MKVSELSELLGVDDKHVHRMATRGRLPGSHVGGGVRFDPQEVANWLRLKYATPAVAHEKATRGISSTPRETSSAA